MKNTRRRKKHPTPASMIVGSPEEGSLQGRGDTSIVELFCWKLNTQHSDSQEPQEKMQLPTSDSLIGSLH